jgi:hypothetical protein
MDFCNNIGKSLSPLISATWFEGDAQRKGLDLGNDHRGLRASGKFRFVGAATPIIFRVPAPLRKIEPK